MRRKWLVALINLFVIFIVTAPPGGIAAVSLVEDETASIYLPLVLSSEPINQLPLATRWGQRNEYTRFSPDNLRLGCWSTALAQILYYHRLVPTGTVSYKCSTGYAVSEDFDAYTFDWSLFVNGFDVNTPEESINEVARYVYFTSVAIQKDYGTGTYVLGHSERAAAIAEHYNCDTVLYSSSSYSMGQLKQIIVQEIEASRPVMMHMRDLSHVSYHAVVVDAFREENGKFMVHINMGWEGSSDGWYDFDSPILNYNDTGYRKIMTIRPK